MSKLTVRLATVVLSLAAFTGSSQYTPAQSTTPPTVVSGGDPQPTGEKPKVVLIFLSMFLAVS